MTFLIKNYPKKIIYKSVYVLKISVIVNFLLSAFTKGAQNSKESNTYSNVIFNSSMSVFFLSSAICIYYVSICKLIHPSLFCIVKCCRYLYIIHVFKICTSNLSNLVDINIASNIAPEWDTLFKCIRPEEILKSDFDPWKCSNKLFHRIYLSTRKI